MERSGIIFCLIGPTGSGKTTHCKKLRKANENTTARSISVTSRMPREREVDGRDYHFVSREEFQKKIDDGDFFEWEEIHGNLYGTLQSSISEAIDSGLDLLITPDIRGAFTLKKKYDKHCSIVFLVPPSKEVLLERIKRRGGVSDEELKARLKTAELEFQLLAKDVDGAGAIDYFVVNDDKEATFSTLSSILSAERSSIERFNIEELRTLFDVTGAK